MTDSIKNMFFSPELYSLFLKYDWQILSNSEKKYFFNYKGEIADYYLKVSYYNNVIKFNYTLDLEFPKDKINDLLLLINFVNQKTKDGYFIYDSEFNKIRFQINKQCFTKFQNKIIKILIEENLIQTNYLFHNFAQATHNLVYAEKIDHNLIDLMFFEIEGNA